MRTRDSAATARERAASRETLAWRSSTSSICRPMRRIGFSAVRGLWNTMEISRPRVAASACGVARSMSMPANRIRPARMSAAASIRPMTAYASTDLPEPLSPTTPTISPRPTLNEAPSSAWTRPERVRKSSTRSSTASSGWLMCGCAGR